MGTTPRAKKMSEESGALQKWGGKCQKSKVVDAHHRWEKTGKGRKRKGKKSRKLLENQLNLKIATNKLCVGQ